MNIVFDFKNPTFAPEYLQEGLFGCVVGDVVYVECN